MLLNNMERIDTIIDALEIVEERAGAHHPNNLRLIELMAKLRADREARIRIAAEP